MTAIAILGIVLTGCNEDNQLTTEGRAVTYQLGDEVSTREGDTVVLANGGKGELIICQANLNDSRCPSDVQCVSPGSYSVDVKIISDNEFVLVSLCNGVCGGGYVENDSEDVILNGVHYTVTLKDMIPYPTTQNQHEPRTAILTLD